MCVYDLFQFCAGALHTVPEAASYPDVSLSLSLDENLREKEGGKEKTGGRLSFFSFPWSLALHQGNCRKKLLSVNLFLFFRVNSVRLSFTSSLYKFLFVALTVIFILYIFSVSELA